MYDVICELEEKGLLKKAIKSGLISITMPGRKMIYEVYLNLRKKGYKEGYGKRQAILKTSVKTDTSQTTIYNIIKMMES